MTYPFATQQLYTEQHLIADIKQYLRLTDSTQPEFYQPGQFRFRTLQILCNRIAQDFAQRPDSYFTDSANVGKLDPSIKFRHAVRFLIVRRDIPLVHEHLSAEDNLHSLKQDQGRAREVLINYVHFMDDAEMESEVAGQANTSTSMEEIFNPEWFTEDGDIKF